MNVRDLLKIVGQAGVVSAGLTTRVPEALMLLAQRNVSSILVLNDEERLAGIFTERDPVRWLANTRVGQIMTPLEKVFSVTMDTPIEECQRLMKEHGIRHLPVLTDGHVPEGVISIRDFLQIP